LIFKKKTPPKAAPEAVDVPEKKGLFKRLSEGLGKTKAKLGEGVATALLGKKQLDDAILESLETVLLSSDVGILATEALLNELTTRVGRGECKDTDAIYAMLKTIMVERLNEPACDFTLNETAETEVIMTIGVNGAGKTTTIGKLAKRFQAADKDVMLAAGDTFRAAAIEQLEAWGERNAVPVIATAAGGDSAAVCFDAVQSARAKNADILMIDTAGRLHTQSHLMDELKKVKRVIQKVDDTAPHKTLLILDASIGQNALEQARLFHEAVGVTHICITKLDGTAKAGIIFAIVEALKLPIAFIGVGEQIDDLQPFSAESFVEALFD
jgi:fused signal recognition particle receptor